MRALALALALFSLPAHAQPTVVDSIKALQAEVAALKADVAALKTRVNVAENSYNILAYYLLGVACYANSMQPTWAVALGVLKPFPLGTLPCPPEGERIYIPSFIGGIGAVLKPPPQ